MSLRKTGLIVAYPAMVLTAAVVFSLVERRGAALLAPSPDNPGASLGSAGAASVTHPLLHVLFALVVMLVCGRCLGFLLRRLGQPPVIGEVVAGILLGPSLFGRVWPEAYAFVLPADVAPLLGMLSQIGVILYMFAVGVSLDLGRLRGREHTTLAISHASIVLPFTLGVLSSLYLYPRVATSDVPFGVFALFVGVSLSVTAFPVLARILTDRRVHRTRMGTIALTCAAVDDVTAWCLLAVVVGIAGGRLGSALVTIALAILYGAFMFAVARPWIARRLAAAERYAHPSQGIPALLLGLVCSSLATEAIGVHAIFGAFVFGALLPSDNALAKSLGKKLEEIVSVLLLPAFFVLTGMRTELGLVTGLQAWTLCGLIVLVACFGKFTGAAAAARLTGLSWRDAAALGVLMNTRGLMELIVLNVGYDLGILSPMLFAMLVIMAIVTTLATSPILHWITRAAPWSEGLV
jgi:Kef-type K+ transport system membrane component KefB